MHADRAHPGALRVQAGFRNEAPWPQAWPELVLTLSDVEGLSYEEIAVVMDTSLGTVKSRLSRARAKLRDFLLEQQELLPKRYRLETDE